jgi:hypothetical protein
MRLSLIGPVLVPGLLAIAMIAQDPSDSKLTPSQTSPNSNQAQPAAKNEGSSHKYHLRLGAVALNGGYISGPLYSYTPYGYYPYYGAAFEPLWAPFNSYYYPPETLAYGADKGQIRLKTDPKDAAVYIDGAYAGTVQHLKSIWLDPGAYDVSISAAGCEPFRQRVYVLTGKTLSINATLSRQVVTGTQEVKP